MLGIELLLSGADRAEKRRGVQQEETLFGRVVRASRTNGGTVAVLETTADRAGCQHRIAEAAISELLTACPYGSRFQKKNRQCSIPPCTRTDGVDAGSARLHVIVDQHETVLVSLKGGDKLEPE